MSILDCLDTKLPRNLMRDVEDIHAEQMQRFNGDVGKADAETVRILEESSSSTKRAKQHAAVTITSMEKEVNEALAAETKVYNAMSGFSKAARRATRRSPSYVRAYTDRFLNRIDNMAEGRTNTALQEMPNLMELIRTRPGYKDREAWEEFVTGLRDGADKVQDQQVRQAVNEYRKYLTKSENNLRGAGLNVGHIPDYIPIRHDFAAIRAADEGVWKQMMFDTTDLGRVYNLREHRAGVSEEAFDRITSSMYRRARDGDAEMADRRIRSERYGFKREDTATDLWGRHSSNRIFQPKDAASYLRYVDDYGGGVENIDKMFLSHINNVERDIATAQVMGPLPFDVNRRMLNRAQRSGASQGQLDFADGMFRTAMNHWNGSIDSLTSRGWQTFQNYLSFNLLGSAPISAIGDQALAGNTRRLMGFVDGDGRMAAFFSQSKMTREDALRGAELAELMARNTVGRFDAHQEDALLGGIAEKSARVRDFSHRWTGLNAMTEAASNQTTMIMFSSLSEKISKQAGFDTLTPDFQRMMGRAGLTEQDWNQLLKFDIKNVPDGFITPNRVRANAPALAQKLDALDVAIRRVAVNAPDLFTRTLSSGRFAGQRAHGDLTHLAMSSLMQFKSFPVQVWRNHFVPAMLRLTDTGNPLPLGIAMLEATFFGAIALQFKQVAAGKAPYDTEHMQSADFVVRAMVQGGFAGLLGDIMLQDPNAYKAGIISRLAGPTATVTENMVLGTMKQAVAFMDGDPETGWDQAGAVQTFKSLIPLQSHWYFKAAIERTLIDTLNSMDPDYHSIMERRHNNLRDKRGAATLEEAMGGM